MYLEVHGKPEYGVGVYRITQNITIEFDDGRVPVLDTEQLNEVLSKLNDSLTESMKNTAEAVKKELRDELDTGVTDAKQECSDDINSAKEELSKRITKNADDVTRLSNRLDSRVCVGRWALPRTTALAGSGSPSSGFLNLLETSPTGMFGRTDIFKYNAANKSLTVPKEQFSLPRILRVDLTLNLTLNSDFDDELEMLLMNREGNTIYGRSIISLKASNYQINGKVNAVQLSSHMYIGINPTDHPLVTDGLRVAIHNTAQSQVTIEGGSSIVLSLT